jgi:peptidoglycan hydrolase CwlO-like protein
MSHVERMKQEHKELKAKIEALNAFIHGNEIFKTLNDLEQARMIKQSGFMESYLQVLESRIWAAK